MPLIGGCESWLRSEAARAACSNSGRSGKPVAKRLLDQKVVGGVSASRELGYHVYIYIYTYVHTQRYIYI